MSFNKQINWWFYNGGWNLVLFLLVILLFKFNYIQLGFHVLMFFILVFLVDKLLVNKNYDKYNINYCSNKRSVIIQTSPVKKISDDNDGNSDDVNDDDFEWGTYQFCDSTKIELRGKNYLIDKKKAPSQPAMFSLIHCELFKSTQKIYNIGHHYKFWFHKNINKLDRDNFYLIIHMRLDSIQTDIVTYHSINMNNIKLDSLLYKFINGTCQFRNDRLKLIARKHDGPFYIYIPQKPAIIGHKLPINYYRYYNTNHYNDIKSINTHSQTFKPYNFNILTFNKDNISVINNNNELCPCKCNNCVWKSTTNMDYPEYLEIYMNVDSNMMAKGIIKMTAPVSQLLSVEMHFTLEGQNIQELPEIMLTNIRLNNVDLSKLKII